MCEEDVSPDTEATNDVGVVLSQLCHYISAASPLPMIAVEGSTHIIRYVNPAFCAMSGTSQANLLGQDFCVIVPEGVGNGCESLLERVLVSGSTETIDDQEHGSASAKIYWSYTAWPVLDTDKNPVGLMVQVTDTTEAVRLRQESVALNEALLLSSVRQHELMGETQDLNVRLERSLQETHHRVKNNLQIISSLVEMQMPEDEDVVPIGAMERIASYIKSLALLHDLLTQKVKSHFDDARLSTVDSLSRLLPLLQTSVGEPRHIATDIADMMLPSHITVSLSLLINELIANAAKHSKGDIFLSLVEDGTHVVLTVRNEGSGFPPNFDPLRDANTGMGLILSFARHDLRGKIEFCNPPEGGACVRVRFPLPSAS